MEQLIVTTVDKLAELAEIIAAIDDDRNDSTARIRLCTRAHDKIQEMLGQHAGRVYDQTEDDDHLGLGVVGYVSAEVE